LAYSYDIQKHKLQQNIPFLLSLIILYNIETVCTTKKSFSLKTFHCENTALLGDYTVDGKFSIVWCQPIGLMLKDGRKYIPQWKEKIQTSSVQRNTGKCLHSRSGRTEKGKCNRQING
jgi:hypothetical protein